MPYDRYARPEDDAIGSDVPCSECGYNLRALQRDGVCPECGTLIAHSLDNRTREEGLRGNTGARRLVVATMVLAVFGPWITLRLWGQLASRSTGISFLVWGFVGLAASAAWCAVNDRRTANRRTLLGKVDHYWKPTLGAAVSALYAYLGYVVCFEAPNWG